MESYERDRKRRERLMAKQRNQIEAPSLQSGSSGHPSDIDSDDALEGFPITLEGNASVTTSKVGTGLTQEEADAQCREWESKLADNPDLELPEDFSKELVEAKDDEIIIPDELTIEAKEESTKYIVAEMLDLIIYKALEIHVVEHKEIWETKWKVTYHAPKSGVKVKGTKKKDKYGRSQELDVDMWDDPNERHAAQFCRKIVDRCVNAAVGVDPDYTPLRKSQEDLDWKERERRRKAKYDKIRRKAEAEKEKLEQFMDKRLTPTEIKLLQEKEDREKEEKRKQEAAEKKRQERGAKLKRDLEEYSRMKEEKKKEKMEESQKWKSAKTKAQQEEEERQRKYREKQQKQIQDYRQKTAAQEAELKKKQREEAAKHRNQVEEKAKIAAERNQQREAAAKADREAREKAKRDAEAAEEQKRKKLEAASQKKTEELAAQRKGKEGEASTPRGNDTVNDSGTRVETMVNPEGKEEEWAVKDGDTAPPASSTTGP
eukprot:GFYU01007148.1.p1 GENE.GFYU01007148.1~~GFYU01007148.1.p1  ORF type:complete len:550 (-),score=226.20 GFYU01007148.1:132-1595(-)